MRFFKGTERTPEMIGPVGQFVTSCRHVHVEGVPWEILPSAQPCLGMNMEDVSRSDLILSRMDN